ncbi:protein kinase [Aeromicrobium sp. NPDC092404]|uniref:serine/threonine-protein kinase n=1 Tax=Aeromicrobium sp. NPDC092404 TaxID=3154976 RepID=UPI00343AA8CD
MPPTTIAGRYAVERAVGRGGMGTVWLCRDELLGRMVAVKEVGSVPGGSTSDLARALREARNSAALNHRNVVAIYDAVEDGDHNWLVMEYVPSRNLSELVTEEGALPPERVAWIGAQVADGLAAAHERGTMHRDVKPGNILVTEDDHVKISDFGIARTYGDATLTRSGVVTGTPAYFAPELARGAEPTLAADVWGLGASLYAAVEGRLPYPDQTNAIALLSRIATEAPAPMEKAGFLNEAITRMMDRDPSTRWTMADAAHALHRLHEQHAIRPAGPTTASLTEPFAGSEQAEPAEPISEPEAGSDAVVAPEADVESGGPPTEPVSPPTSDSIRRISTPPPTADPSPGRGDDDHGRRGLAIAAALLVVALAALGGAWLVNQDGDDDPTARQESTSSPSSEADGSEAPSDESGDADNDDSSGSGSGSGADSSGTGEGEPSSDPAQFVEDYYSLLPGDTKTAWALLSPGMQDTVGGYGSYAGFWRTVEAVRVDETTAVEEGVVDVRLTYTTSRGVESETRRLRLVDGGKGLQIDGDQTV